MISQLVPVKRKFRLNNPRKRRKTKRAKRRKLLHPRRLKILMSKLKKLRIRKMIRMTPVKNTNKWRVETPKPSRAMTVMSGSSSQVRDKPLPHHAFRRVSHNKKVKNYKLSTLVKSLPCLRPMQIKAKEQKSNSNRQPR